MREDGGKRNEGGRNLEMDQVCVGRRRRTPPLPYNNTHQKTRSGNSDKRPFQSKTGRRFRCLGTPGDRNRIYLSCHQSVLILFCRDQPGLKKTERYVSAN
ncbi:hypothetical protein TWF506_011111 [Arthrobotrys conoides]|uniref:Uncharacterized protein n=1 Tax=Arthrobotrys conoides TaxID=74498 RepID=A0AAN8RRU5_9PEZI